MQRLRNIVMFSSGGPNNFATVLAFCADTRNCARVVALISDRSGIAAIDLAKEHSIETFVIPVAGRFDPADWSALRERAEGCDRILATLKEIELKATYLDLIVLAYRKVLVGAILREYGHKMINVHPADLSVEDIRSRRRRYVGIGGLARSIEDGNATTRTTIHWVDGDIDTGPLICLGPSIPVTHDGSSDLLQRHEQKQKQLSDRPALLAALHHVLSAQPTSVLIL